MLVLPTELTGALANFLCMSSAELVTIPLTQNPCCNLARCCSCASQASSLFANDGRSRANGNPVGVMLSFMVWREGVLLIITTGYFHPFFCENNARNG